MFRGAGWNVIKVIWGSRWDELLARDVDGVLLDKMNTTLDGEFQKYATESGAYIREHFFGPDPRLRKLVEHLTDDELQALPRGGHDYRKLYAAYKLATEHAGAPTAILAKTIKGWTLGPEIEARNATHQIKKMTKAQLRGAAGPPLPAEEIPDEALDADEPPVLPPARGLAGARVPDGPAQGAGRPGAAAGRPARPPGHACPDPKVFADLLAGSGGQAVSTTMAFARLLRNLRPRPGARPLRRPDRPRRGPHLRPRAAHRRGRRSTPPEGQRYTPVDADLLLRYAESAVGPDPPGGHHRGRGDGDASSPLATSYATWGRPDAADLPLLFDVRLPADRRPDLAARRHARAAASWPAAPPAARRCSGEGLQHDDGHSPLLASVEPGRPRSTTRPSPTRSAIDRRGRRSTEIIGPDARGPVLLPHPLQRELPDAGACPRGRPATPIRAGHPARPLPLRRAGASSTVEHGRRRADDPVFSGPMWQAAMRGPPSCWPTTGASRPTPGR